MTAATSPSSDPACDECCHPQSWHDSYGCGGEVNDYLDEENVGYTDPCPCKQFRKGNRMTTIRDELDWMQTYTGKAFFPLDPSPEDLDIHDIAFGLARCCRFAGQVQRFYSVAEHSVHVSFECSPRHALEGLMHDAAEAYVGDITRPVKLALRQIDSGRIGATGRSSYDDLEDAICRAIAKRWRLTYPWPDDVKHADEAVLMAERRDLMRKPPPRPYRENAEASKQHAEGWTDGVAAREFLKRFHYLALERGTEIAHGQR